MSMPRTVMLRCTDADRERWYTAAGGKRNFSDWARRAMDTAAAGVTTAPVPPDGGAKPAQRRRGEPPAVAALCRHDLADCRVCKIGRYAGAGHE